VIVPQAELVRGVMHARVDDDIRHWAKRRVVESQRALDAQRVQAMRDGYRDGLAAALEDVVAHLMRTEQLCDRWRSDMTEQVREVLTSASQHPHALLAALDDAVHTLAGPRGATSITVVLPLRLKPRREEILARVATVGHIPVTLEFRARDERISVMRGDTVIEYDPSDYVARAEAALDIDPRAPRQDLHELLAAALSPLAERVKELRELSEPNGGSPTPPHQIPPGVCAGVCAKGQAEMPGDALAPQDEPFRNGE
jgi:hypothetical protein